MLTYPRCRFPLARTSDTCNYLPKYSKAGCGFGSIQNFPSIMFFSENNAKHSLKIATTILGTTGVKAKDSGSLATSCISFHAVLGDIKLVIF